MISSIHVVSDVASCLAESVMISSVLAVSDVVSSVLLKVL